MGCNSRIRSSQLSHRKIMPSQSFPVRKNQPIIYFPYPVGAVSFGQYFAYGSILDEFQNNFAFQYLGRLAFGSVNVDVPPPQSQLFIWRTEPIYMAGSLFGVNAPVPFNGNVGLIFNPADQLDGKTITLVV